MFLAVAVAVLFLTVSTAAQTKQGHQHRRNGDVWVGCVADAPATTWERALFNALSIGDKENRSCWVSRQRGWWVFHRTKKFPVVIFPFKKEQQRAGEIVGPFFYPSIVLGCTIRKHSTLLS